MCRDEEGEEKNSCHLKEMPSKSATCNEEPCPAWNFGEWGKVKNPTITFFNTSLNLQCDKLCGGGISNRLVRCQDHLGQNLPDQKCDLKQKPSMTQECNTKECQVLRRRRFLWRVGKWSRV